MSPQIETFIAFSSLDSICAQTDIRRIRLSPGRFSSSAWKASYGTRWNNRGNGQLANYKV